MSSIVSKQENPLKEIIHLFLGAWKIILLFGLLGFMSSATYLLVKPKRYEATAQIQMAQINIIHKSNNTNSSLSVNVEDPNLLLARMRIPSSYSSLQIKACGFDPSNVSAEYLKEHVNFSEVKGVNSIIELKVKLDSRESAISCAQSIFETVRDYQNQLIRPYIDEAKNLLLTNQARLKDAKMIVARADNSDSLLSVAYLVSRDEVRFLADENIRLNTFITTGFSRQARLISPIYAANSPFLPNVKVTIVSCLILGLLLGFVFVILKKNLASF